MAHAILAVLFDLDETLLDRQGSLGRFLAWESRELLGMSKADAERYVARFIQLDSNGSVWKDKVYNQLVEEFAISSHSAAELLTNYTENFYKFCRSKPGANEAVAKLKSRGLKIALVSNGMTPFQERNFESLGMSEHFDSVVVSGAVNLRKPDPKIFLLACANVGVTPADCAFVGDNPDADIRAANAMGMYSVFIPTRFHPHCPHARSTCDDFRRLDSIILLAN